MPDNKPWESETTPPTIPTEATLLGSSVQPDVFVDADGKEVPLGDVVQFAFDQTGLEVESWNELSDEDREARIQAVVDEHFPSVAPPTPETPDLDALKKQADELGVQYAPNIGATTLAARIAEATANVDSEKPDPTDLAAATDLDKQVKPHEGIVNTKYQPPAENAPLALVNLVSQGMSMKAAKAKLGIK